MNSALKAIGVSALGSNSGVWSCSRYYPIFGWIASGYSGYAYGNYLSSRAVAAPLVLLNAAGGAA